QPDRLNYRIADEALRDTGGGNEDPLSNLRCAPVLGVDLVGGEHGGLVGDLVASVPQVIDDHFPLVNVPRPREIPYVLEDNNGRLAGADGLLDVEEQG